MAGFTSLLKAIGQGVVKAFGIFASNPALQSVAAAYIPGAAPILQPIIGIVAAVERAFAIAQPQGKSGPQKFQAALPLVEQVIRNSELVVGREIADEAMLTRGAGKILDGMVDVLNSLKSPA